MNPEVDAFLKSECFTRCFLPFHEVDPMLYSQCLILTRALVSVPKVDPQISLTSRTDPHIALLILRLVVVL
jgi:hypothetical protein